MAERCAELDRWQVLLGTPELRRLLEQGAPASP
jgi:hypothetical protein